MSSAVWKPDEARTILAEGTWLQGAFIMCIAYGAVATLAIQCFVMLVKDFKIAKLSRDGPLLAYVVSIFVLCTMFIGAGMVFTQRAFVDNRNIPGGPLVYEAEAFSSPIHNLLNGVLIVSTSLSDALLLWRCTVVYCHSSIPPKVVYLAAGILWLTELIIGILFLIQICSQFTLILTTLTVAFWGYSLALNIFATSIIVGRLLVYRYRLSCVLGKRHGIQYTSIIAMIVESEMFYTTFLILYMVPFVRHYPLAYAFIQGPGQVQAVGALMIVYRVAQGKAWSKDSCPQITTRNRRMRTIQINELPVHLSSPTVDSDLECAESKNIARINMQITQDIHLDVEPTAAVT
ncbi:hypothetical protein EIP86_008534 [Pleurotus ostreatoroseus]|nr:hypothetical protein EIP86_008534 [Pleurotus ostreatoroseus]